MAATTRLGLVGRIWEALRTSPAAEADKPPVRPGITRHQRYGIREAFAKQTAYTGTYGPSVREEFSVYRHTRPIFGRCNRILSVHRALTMGGILDPDAGDGKGSVPSCLPIMAGKDADQATISRAVASLWSASNWQQKKGVYTATGATCGDVGIEVIAIEERGLVRLRVIHPSEILDSPVLDSYGNVKAISLARSEPDPEDPDGEDEAAYRIRMVNDGKDVIANTYRNDKPYRWPGTPGSEYKLPWPFVPIVLVKHIDDGGEWGEAEHDAAIYKTTQEDSQGSLLSDSVENTVLVQWLLTGSVKLPTASAAGRPNLAFEFVPSEVSTGGRDMVRILQVNSADAKMTPLVYPVPIREADEHRRSISASIEDDYPELRINPVGANASGESRREARREVESKIQERRASYDAGLVRAQQMAMTMGGMLGFEAYSGFTKDSFRDGKTDHRIGSRPVFGVDPLDALAERKAEADAIKVLTDAGVPLEQAAKRVGWSAADIDELRALLALQDDEEEEFRSDELPVVRNGLAVIGQ